MSVIYEAIGSSSNTGFGIRVEAEVTEFYLGETRFGKSYELEYKIVTNNI